MSSSVLPSGSDELAAALLAGERLPFDLYSGSPLPLADAAPASPGASPAAAVPGSGAARGGHPIPEAWADPYLHSYVGVNQAVRAGFDPPRFCGLCARRMVVQVRPDGWSARCSRHGWVDSAWLER